ncbi:MAG TPA: sigma-54-dependent Fis family transcriptional regulator [Thermodesulfobacteriaceae bacterium]|nr:sigma-54-dependent Fis family transcriptional regulator [Thermodesulfobacteriaceae bacterium]
MVTKPRVLVIDDESDVRNTIAAILSSRKGGYEVVLAASAAEGLALVKKQPFDHVLSDIYMEPEDGLFFLSQAKKDDIPANIIMMSGQADADMAIKAIKMGACDYIHKPVTAGQLFFVLQRAEEQSRLKKENAFLRSEIQKKYSFNNIVAKSPKMLRIFNIIAKVADYKTTVMITGESGTGKELVAKAVHFNSNRRKHPFVPVNCGGIPENLLESELFGHVKGAFTDAVRAKKGLFEEADGGTMFLDELGDLPFPLQVKLLRVLQEEEIRPLGDTRNIKVDVRIVAATARNLEQDVKNGRFREDLYYRINVLSIVIPPIRERKEDIPLLVDHFRVKYNQRLGTAVRGVHPEVMRLFLEYRWPGNVRELENVMERAMVLTETDTIKVEDLPKQIRMSTGVGMPPSIPGLDGTILSIKQSSKILEKELIKKALAKTGGNKTQAAQLLEISLPALLYKMKGYGIVPEPGQAGENEIDA